MRAEALGRFLVLGESGEYTFWHRWSDGWMRVTQLHTKEEANPNPTEVEFYWDADGTERRR